MTSPRALAEPAANRTFPAIPKHAPEHAAAPARTAPVADAAGKVVVAVAPLDLKSLPATAFADWEPEHF